MVLVLQFKAPKEITSVQTELLLLLGILYSYITLTSKVFVLQKYWKVDRKNMAVEYPGLMKGGSKILGGRGQTFVSWTLLYWLETG